MINLSVFDHLGIGQTGSFLCPTCEGGSSRERTMTVNKDAYGVVKWYCFRSSCGERGTNFAGGQSKTEAMLNPLPVVQEIRPYTGRLIKLTDLEFSYFSKTFNISKPDMYMDDTGRYILPIRKLSTICRGHISRRPWSGHDPADTRPKSLTYWHEPGPLLSWYKPADRNDENDCSFNSNIVLLVEDQLSAMRAAEYLHVTTCALLGTGINAEKVAEIQQSASYVIIALDSDATGQAFAMARKWGQAFDSCKVLVLTQDIKDMPLEQLKALSI